MHASKTDSDYLESTTNPYGIDYSSYNYSVDTMKKAAFIDELNSVLILKNSVDFDPVINYLKSRIDEINTKYK